MSRSAWTMLAVIVGSGVVFLDGTVVNVALPRIGQELPATLVGVLEGQTYVNSGYLAVLSALLVLSGALNDYYGRRLMFSIGLAGFGITSLLCGLAPTLELLVLFRLLQGAAGALLVPGSLAIITATFSGTERGRAFGVWAAATSALTTVGPILGGALVDTLSWRVAFLINPPLIAVALYATLRHVPETRDEQASSRFDWLGAAVVALAVGGLSFGLIRGQEREWNDPVAFVALGAGLVAAGVFPVLMARSTNPLVPLGLFRLRNFAVINLATFLVYGALYVSLAFQGLFLQGTLGYTALAAGATGVPVGILLALFSAKVGGLCGRFGVRPFLVAGPVLMAAGFLWLARIPASSQPWVAQPERLASLVPSAGFLVDVLPGVLVFGVGLTLVVAPITTALMGSVPVRRSGLASAINNAISRVGAPLVGAIIFIAITASYWASIGSKVPGLDTSSPALRRQLAPLNRPPASLPAPQRAAAREASTDAFRVAMLVSAALMVAGAGVSGLGLRRRTEPVDEAIESERASPAAI
ncbi:MAG: MFS transporter [Chloroflexota bacterium]|nr:MFS transporter [Chloroflexota bacterium]